MVRGPGSWGPSYYSNKERCNKRGFLLKATNWRKSRSHCLFKQLQGQQWHQQSALCQQQRKYSRQFVDDWDESTCFSTTYHPWPWHFNCSLVRHFGKPWVWERQCTLNFSKISLYSLNRCQLTHDFLCTEGALLFWEQYTLCTGLKSKLYLEFIP